MALGIFTLDALQSIPLTNLGTITKAMTIATIAVALWTAYSLTQSFRRGDLVQALGDPARRFGLGTWVAGISVLAMLIVAVFPGLPSVCWALETLAVLFWALLLALTALGLRTKARRQWPHLVKGDILLVTVATESIVLGLLAITHNSLPHWASKSLILAGLLFYGLGGLAVGRSYARSTRWTLSNDWHNTNCILHGAISIIGLAMITSSAFPRFIVTIVWICAATMFVLVETVELARARRRIQSYGFRSGVLAYDVSQWARVFTFGMFYAFTLHARVNRIAVPSVPTLDRVQVLVAAYGQYVVLFVLLVEVLIFAYAKFNKLQDRKWVEANL